MFQETNRQIEPSFCTLALEKPIYLPPIFRGQRNEKFVESPKKSANIWLCLRKTFQTILNVCLNRKLSKNH